MIRRFGAAALLAAAFALSGCEDPDTYPISGQDCAPSDPVRGMDASDCVAPIPGIGGM